MRHADGAGAQGGTIDVGELCSTQPDIVVNDFVLLQDDKQTQPADNISPLVRNDFLAKIDKTSFEKLLNDLSAKIDTATLADLGKQVASTRRTSRTWCRRGSRPRASSSNARYARTPRAPASPGPFFVGRRTGRGHRPRSIP